MKVDLCPGRQSLLLLPGPYLVQRKLGQAGGGIGWIPSRFVNEKFDPGKRFTIFGLVELM